MVEKSQFYINIFNKIISKISDTLIGLKLRVEYQDEADIIVPTNSVSPSKDCSFCWKRRFKCNNKIVQLICSCRDESFYKTCSKQLYYSPNDKTFPLLDMLIERILEEMEKIISNDIITGYVTVNYRGDVNILVYQAVIDFFSEKKFPEVSLLTYLSSLSYEKEQCYGKVLFVDDFSTISEKNIIKFSEPIIFDEENQRMIRKVLEMQDDSVYVLVDTNDNTIRGIVHSIADDIKKDRFILQFVGHTWWKLQKNDIQIMEYKNGYYCIVRQNEQEKWKNELKSIYTNCDEDVAWAIEVIEAARKQGKGTTLVVLNDGEQEALRLCKLNRGINVEKFNMRERGNLVKAISAIDGAIMLDYSMHCYAVGVLLDGPAYNGNISRGARFNSALSYVNWKRTAYGAWAVVISEDGMVNIVK